MTTPSERWSLAGFAISPQGEYVALLQRAVKPEPEVFDEHRFCRVTNTDSTDQNGVADELAALRALVEQVRACVRR